MSLDDPEKAIRKSRRTISSSPAPEVVLYQEQPSPEQDHAQDEQLGVGSEISQEAQKQEQIEQQEEKQASALLLADWAHSRFATTAMCKNLWSRMQGAASLVGTEGVSCLCVAASLLTVTRQPRERVDAGCRRGTTGRLKIGRAHV